MMKLTLVPNRSTQPMYARLVTYRYTTPRKPTGTGIIGRVAPTGIKWRDGEEPVIVDLRWSQLKRPVDTDPVTEREWKRHVRAEDERTAAAYRYAERHGRLPADAANLFRGPR